MSEYATYKLWNGCKAPNNLEFNGRLIGEKVTSTTPTTQMSYEYGNGDNRTEEYMELIARSPEDVPDYCPFCGARVVRDHDDA